MIRRYRKKPIAILAVVWDGNNIDEVKSFAKDNAYFKYREKELWLRTLEGNMKATIGDYIIQGVDGEFYACKPDIFRKTYELVDRF